MSRYVQLSDSFGQNIPLVHASFVSTVIDFVSTTQVTLHFKNDLAQELIEVIYGHPIDPDAAIHRIVIDVGGRTIEASVHDSEKAENKYREAVKAGHGAYMAQRDHSQTDVYQFSIGNIRVGEDVKVQVSYIADVKLDDNQNDGSILRFSLPLGICHRYNPISSSLSRGDQGKGTSSLGLAVVDLPIDISLNIQMPCDIDSLSSPSSIPLQINFDKVTRSRSQVTAHTTSAAGDFVVLIKRSQQYKAHLWLPRPGSDVGRKNGEVISMVSLHPDVSPLYANEQISDLIFVIDQSG